MPSLFCYNSTSGCFSDHYVRTVARLKNNGRSRKSEFKKGEPPCKRPKLGVHVLQSNTVNVSQDNHSPDSVEDDHSPNHDSDHSPNDVSVEDDHSPNDASVENDHSPNDASVEDDYSVEDDHSPNHEDDHFPNDVSVENDHSCNHDSVADDHFPNDASVENANHDSVEDDHSPNDASVENDHSPNDASIENDHAPNDASVENDHSPNDASVEDDYSVEDDHSPNHEDDHFPNDVSVENDHSCNHDSVADDHFPNDASVENANHDSVEDDNDASVEDDLYDISQDDLPLNQDGGIDEDSQKLLTQTKLELFEVQIENEILIQKNIHLRSENQQLRGQVQELKNMAASVYTCSLANQFQMTYGSSGTFSASLLKGDDQMTCFYTGLPSHQLFNELFLLLQPLILKGEGKSHCSLQDEFLIVLMKLRLGVPNDDLAYRVGISPSTVSRIFHKWIDLMSVELECLIVWPNSDELRETMPVCFRKHYSNVKCIIDCFEIFIERPVAFEARAQTYSNYKKHNTLKVLLGIAPTGNISFISQAWGGRVSDKEITQKCGFLNHIAYGDIIMADRGFNVADDLAVCGACLLIPAFTRGKTQLTQRELEQTRRLA